MASNSINFKINFDTNTSGIVQAQKALEQLRNLSNKDIAIFNNTGLDETGLKKARSIMMDIQTESGKAQKAMAAAFNQKLGTVNMERFREELQKNGTSLEQFRNTMAKAGPIGEKAFTEMAAGLSNVKYQTVQTTTILDKMTASLQRSLTTFVSINIINKVKGSINEAYGYVKNLDTSLNQIRIVTGKSADEMDRFAEKANKAAASLGKATTDYTKASTTFYQQGLGDTEVQARTDVTLKAANTTGQDSKVVADNLTALWNGFNVGAEEAEIYVDRLAALAATTASNLDELTTAMSKTASMASVMGVSEEQLAAQIATVVSVTRQAPESVGTAFKSIYSRISDINAGAEEAETTLGNYSSKLAALGINVLDSSGKLRNMGEVIEEVGGKWKNYSKEQQVAIAGIMGGQRQVNQVTALFDNWDEYTESIKTMANAEGTLQKQQDVYMESAQGQLQKLRTEWEGVLDSLLKAEDIVKVTKAISPIFTSLEKVIDAFGGGLGILTKFSPLLLGLATPKIAEGIGKIGSSFSAAATNAEIAKSEVQDFQNLLMEKTGGDANALSGYTQEIQELIKKYGELRDTMSIEQKNQFKESLKEIIEKEGPKAREELEAYYSDVRKILDTDYGKGNKTLSSVLGSKEELESYQEKVKNLQKELAKDPQEIIDNYNQIKEKINEVFGDSQEGKALKQELELIVNDKSLEPARESIKEAFENGVDQVDFTSLKEKINETLGENSEAAETTIAGLNKIEELHKSIIRYEEIEKENQEKVNKAVQEEEQAQKEVHRLAQERRDKSNIWKEEEEKYNKRITEAQKEQAQVLAATGTQNIEQLKRRLEISETLLSSGQEMTAEQQKELEDLRFYVDYYDEWEQEIQDCGEGIKNLHQDQDKLSQAQAQAAKNVAAASAAQAEATAQEKAAKEERIKYSRRLSEIERQLTTGEIDEATAQEMVAEATEHTNGVLAELEGNLNQVSEDLNEQSQRTADTAAKTRELRAAFGELQKQNVAQNILNVGTALFSVWTTAKGLYNTVTDESLSTSEKVERTITALLAALGALAFAIKTVTAEETKKAFAQTASALTTLAEWVAAKTASKGWLLYAAANKIATIAATNLAVAVAASAGVIGLVALAIYGVIQSIKKWEKEHMTVSERLEKANEQLEEAKNKYKELNDLITDYEETKKAFEELEKGTVEYAEAIADLNNKVLKLIETYPELKRFMAVGENGVLEISEDGLQALAELQKEEINEANRNAILAAVSTENDRREIETEIQNQTGIYSYDGQSLRYSSLDELNEDQKKYLKAYNARMDAIDKANEGLLASYSKTFSAFAEYNSDEMNKVIHELWLEYDGNVEKIQEAIQDTEGMLVRIQQKRKTDTYTENKTGINNISSILSGDYSSTNVEDNQSLQVMVSKVKDQTFDDLIKASDEYSKSLKALVIQNYGEITEDNVKQMKIQLSNAVDGMIEETKEKIDKDVDIGSWLFSSVGLNQEVVDKFIDKVDGITPQIKRDLGKGIADAVNNFGELDDGNFEKKMTDLLADVDWSQGVEGLKPLEEYLEQFGLTLDSLGPEIKTYTNEQIALNTAWSASTVALNQLTAAMGTVSGLKFGSMLSEKDYTELISNFSELETYFVKIGEKYKFIATDTKKVQKDIEKAFIEHKKNIAKEVEELDKIKFTRFGDEKERIEEEGFTESGKINEGTKKSIQGIANRYNNIINGLSTDLLNSLEGFSEKSIKELMGKITSGEFNEEELQRYIELLGVLDGKLQAIDEHGKDAEEDQKIYIETYIHSVAALNNAIKPNENGDSVIDVEVAEKQLQQVRAEELASLGYREEAYQDWAEKTGREINNVKDVGKEAANLFAFEWSLAGQEVMDSWMNTILDLPSKLEGNEGEFQKAAKAMQKAFNDAFPGIDIEINTDFVQEYTELIKNGDLDGIHTLLEQILGDSVDIDNIWPLIESDIKKATKAIQEQAKEVRKLITDYKKISIDNALADSDRRSKRYEDQMAHSVGSEYISAYKGWQNEQQNQKNLKQQSLNIDKEQNALDWKDFRTDLANQKISMTEIAAITSYTENQLNTLDPKLKELYSTYVQLTQETTSLKNAQADLDEEYATGFVTIDKLATSAGVLSQKERELADINNQIDTGLIGQDLVDALEKRQKIEKEITSEKKNQLKIQKELLKDSANNLSNALSIKGIQLSDYYDSETQSFDKTGLLTTLSKVEGITQTEIDKITNELIPAIENNISAYNDIETSLKQYYKAIDQTEDEQNQIAANNIELSRLQQQATGLTGKALKDNQDQQKAIQQKNKELYQSILDYQKTVTSSYVTRLDTAMKDTGVTVKIDNGFITNLEQIRQTLQTLGWSQEDIDNIVNATNDSLSVERNSQDSIKNIEGEIVKGETEAEYNIRKNKEEIEEKKVERDKYDKNSPEYARLSSEINILESENVETLTNEAKRLRGEFNNSYKDAFIKAQSKITNNNEEDRKAGKKNMTWADWGYKLQEDGTFTQPNSLEGIPTEITQEVQDYNKALRETTDAEHEATMANYELLGSISDTNQERLKQIQIDKKNIDDDISSLEKEKVNADPEGALAIQAKINEKQAEKNKLLKEELEVQQDIQETAKEIVTSENTILQKKNGDKIENFKITKEMVEKYQKEDGTFDEAGFKQEIGYNELLTGSQTIVNDFIDQMTKAGDAVKDINENLKIVKLPYNAYEKFEIETKRIEKAEKDLEQQQDALNNKFEESERRISDLQGEAEFLTGDDLVANLEQQADELQKQIEYKKEQAELDKKAIELAERKKKNAEEEAEYAKKALEILKNSVNEKIKKTDVEGSMEKGATDEQKAQAQAFFDNFDIEKYIDKETGILSTNKLRAELLELGLTAKTVDEYLKDYNNALDKYDSATDAATAATKAYDEANQKYANTLQEVTEKERERIKAEREAAQQKLQTGEDAINRETNAQHKLEKALRNVDKAIQQVQKDQNDLSGQQLISKIQEEIQLQQKKKQVLEQQLKQIKEQIQALIDLYALHMSTEYGINVGFNVDETGVTNIDELYAAIEGLDAEMKGAATEDLERMVSAIQSLTSNAASAMDSIDGMTNTIDDLNKKLKEQQEADLFRIKDEKWNYEEQQLKRIDKALQSIQKDQSKLSGNALIANLTAQQKMLDKQVETYQRKLELMKAELSAMQSMLAMQGVIFDSNGLISNYAQAYANMDDKTRGYMQSYQSLYDQIMDLESTIQDTYDKKADLEIQKTQERLKMFNAKVDVELNMEKAKREWQKFKKEFLNTLNGFEELNDSILEKTKQNMKDIYSMTTKDVTLLTDHVSRIIDEIHLMQGGGTSSLYGTDQSTAISDLANYRQQIQESLSSIADKMREVNEAYLQQLDKIQGKFDEQLSNYELIQNIISHDMNIIKILRGDNAYEELSRYYDKATANYEQEIAFLRKQVDYWRKLMEQEPVGTKKWEYFQQHWKDALSKLNSAVDAALENIVAKYDTKLQAIFQKIKKNSKLDWKLEKWDLDKQLSEMFTDQITTEYSLQKLQDQYIKAAQDTDDPTKKQKILDIMRDQIKAYRELSKESIRKGRLTEREIELANKQYELEMARLELQDQEKNKTKMRLRRDSSGDYRYEFVADEEKIEDIRQKILDLEEEIRLFAEETRKQVIDTYTGAVQTALDGMQQAYQDWRDGIITDEELQERLAYYKDWLTQMGAATSTQYGAAITALVQATADEMRDLGIAADEDIERLKQHVIATMEELYPTFGDLFYSLDEQIAEIEGLVGQATTELLDLMAEMKAEFAAIGDAAGICFDSIIDGTDVTIDQMYQLIDDNYELLDQYELELSQIEALIDELSRLQDAYRDVYDAAMEAVDAALELKETAQSIPDYSSTFNQQINIGTGGGSVAPSSSTSGKSTTPSWLSKSYKSKSNTMKKEEEKPVTEVKSDISSIGEIRADKAKDLFKRGTSFIYSIITQSYKEEYVSSGAGQLDDGELIGLSTGGYTGDWGSNGKVALLHEKELVLNKDDTKNILDAVQILRQNNNPSNYNDSLINSLSNLIDTTYDFYTQMLDMATEQLNALTSATQMINQVTTNNTTNNINASFPNATQYNEIEKALQNLGNATSQRLGLNKRR